MAKKLLKTLKITKFTMAIDNLEELNQPTKTKMTLFQKIVQTAEIGLLILACISFFFRASSFDYQAEFMMISFLGLSFLYIFLPVFLFRSKKIGEHFAAHFAGFLLFLSIIGFLFRIESWPYGRQVQTIPLLLFPIMVVSLMIINAKDKDKINFYLRVTLRFVVILMPFLLWFGFDFDF
jgi:hypothetical protein